jgi:hypothetical protein
MAATAEKTYQHGSPIATSQDSAANTAQTITVAAVAGKYHHASGLSVYVSAAAAVSDITVELKDGATVKWKGIIGAGAERGSSVERTFDPPIRGTTNTAMTLVVSAGGASVVTTANLQGYTI